MPDTHVDTTAIAAPQLRTEDPAKAIGDVFRRLALASETFGPPAFQRIVAAVLVALGRAVLTEAEREARWRRERDILRPGEIPAPGKIHAGDFDTMDCGDPD